MAQFSIRNIFRRNRNNVISAPVGAQPESQPRKTVIGAANQTESSLKAFDNSNITYSSDMSNVDYDSILRDKQSNIDTLYQLADYYCDADPIVRGIIKGVYVPFSSTKWHLTGENAKTIAIFEEQYRTMRLNELIDDMFLQYWKYGNVYTYIWKGNIMTLPPHKCKIGNTMLNGTPIVDFNVQDLQNEFRERTYSVKEASGVKDDDLDRILKGYPPEIAQAIKSGAQYAQLDPANVHVLQCSKEGWTRYAIPWIASALPALAKKELISKYEASLLNLGARSFLHVTYGDSTKGQDMLPDGEQLREVRSIFASAMANNPLAVTNHLVKAQVIQADLSDLYQWPLYEQVNADILAAGGVAGIIVNGNSEDGSTFASAQVSMQAAASRINAARAEFEQFMNKVNQRLVEDLKLVRTNNLKDIPEFHFVPMDMNGDKAFRDACEKLWQQGLVSTRTLMEISGFNLSKEKDRRETEASDGTDEVMIPRQIQQAMQNQDASSENVNEDKKSPGRPKLDNNERHSDPDNAERSKQAKDAAEGINSE